MMYICYNINVTRVDKPKHRSLRLQKASTCKVGLRALRLKGEGGGKGRGRKRACDRALH